jgi:FkbM family methyltransferase
MSLKDRIAQYFSEHYPRLWTQFNIRFRKHHFESEYWLIPLFCSPRKDAIDVGVNMGDFSFYMARYARQVVGFEPNIDLWPHLHRFLNRNVRLESAALSDKAGTAALRYVEDNTGVATIEGNNPLSMIDRPETIKTRSVVLRTLDSFALSNISFIKIDVEGHEEAVLRGAEATLANNRPAVLVESEDRHNPGAPRRLADWFAERGYAGFFIKQRRLYPVDMLEAADTDPSNLSVASRIYINNFVYLPRSDTALIERISAAAARL